MSLAAWSGRRSQWPRRIGRELTFGYDALGRKLWQGENWLSLGNARFGYDAGGRRTRLTWSDGARVGYDWRVTGELGAIRGQDGAVLVAFVYDGLGRRTELARATGTATRYGFDPASRLRNVTSGGRAGGGGDAERRCGGANRARIVTSTDGSSSWTSRYPA